MRDEDLQIFSAWFHNDRELPNGGTPAERYAARLDLPAEEREAAERIASANLGLHRVLAVEPGHWIELGDVVSGRRNSARALVSTPSERIGGFSVIANGFPRGAQGLAEQPTAAPNM